MPDGDIGARMARIPDMAAPRVVNKNANSVTLSWTIGDGLPYDFVVLSKRESSIGDKASFDEVSTTTSNSATVKGLL